MKYHVNVESRGRRAGHRGDRQAAGRRRGSPRGGRRRRPGQRPGRRPAKGAQRHVPEPRASMHLVDYKVRVINTEAATAAGVRVVIESRDETTTCGAPSASAKTSSKPAGSPWSTASSTSCARMRRSRSGVRDRGKQSEHPLRTSRLCEKIKAFDPDFQKSKLRKQHSMQDLPTQYDHAAAQETLVPVLGGAAAISTRSPSSERRQAAVHDRHPAAERHRGAAPGACAEQHAARHPRPA